MDQLLGAGQHHSTKPPHFENSRVYGRKNEKGTEPPERRVDPEMKSVEIFKAMKTQNYCAEPLVVDNQ